MHHYAVANTNARSTWKAAKTAVTNNVALHTTEIMTANCLGMGNHCGQLSRQRNQKSFFGFVKTALIALLHNKHTEDAPLVHDGHTQE